MKIRDAFWERDWNMLKQTVAAYIKRHRLITSGDAVVSALSGGADSLCLTHLLKSMEADLGFRLVAAHFNHRLRGADADADAAFVEEWCRLRGIPFELGGADVAREAELAGESLEAAARRLRYGFLESVRECWNAQRIAVGHHRGDQAETVLLNLMRGSGLDGLSGIRPMRSGGIIRPLLETSRESIEIYCREQRLCPREDHTNSDTAYTRNRIRWEVLPLLKEGFNPRLEETLGRTAGLLATDADFINASAQEAFTRIAELKSDSVHITLKDLQSLHPALEPRVLRQTVQYLRGQRTDFSADAVSRVQELIRNGHTGKGYRFRDIEFHVAYGVLTISRTCMENRAAEDECPVPWPQEPVEVETVWGRLTLEIVGPERLAAAREAGPWTALLDADVVQGPLSLRTRRAGDQFWPLGAPGRRKLKDYLIDRKVPREQRAGMPLLCDSEKILWVPGYQPDHRARITVGTRKALWACLEVRCSRCRNVLE